MSTTVYQGQLSNLGAPAYNPECLQVPTFWAAFVFNTNQSTIVTRTGRFWNILASDNATFLSNQTWRNLRTSEGQDASVIDIGLWRTFGDAELTCSPAEAQGTFRLTPKALDECCIDGQGYQVKVNWNIGCDGGSGSYQFSVPNPCTCGPTTRHALEALIEEWEEISGTLQYDPIESVELVENTGTTALSTPFELLITLNAGIDARITGAGWSAIERLTLTSISMTGAKLKALARDNNIHFTDGSSGDPDGAFSDTALYDIIKAFVPVKHLTLEGHAGTSYGSNNRDFAVRIREVWFCGKQGTMNMATICSGLINATTAHTIIPSCVCSDEPELTEQALPYCVYRADDGDDTALGVIEGDYDTDLSTDFVSIVRTGIATSGSGQNITYYTLYATGGTPTAHAGDIVREGACGDDDVAIIEGYEADI